MQGFGVRLRRLRSGMCRVPQDVNELVEFGNRGCKLDLQIIKTFIFSASLLWQSIGRSRSEISFLRVLR